MKRKLITILLLLVTQVVLPQTQDEWITYFERSGFTETPSYRESMEYFQKLADYSPLAEFKSFGVSPQGRELKFLIVSKEEDGELGSGVILTPEGEVRKVKKNE